MSGLVALVGGTEFTAGNEACDRRLIAAAPRGPRLVLPTAAARQGPDRAIDAARRWFSRLGSHVEALARSMLVRASWPDRSTSAPRCSGTAAAGR